MTANAEFAEQLRRQADDAMARRRILLVASVAAETTRTIPAAIRALGEWNGPAAIKTAAIELLGDLTRQEGAT